MRGCRGWRAGWNPSLCEGLGRLVGWMLPWKAQLEWDSAPERPSVVAISALSMSSGSNPIRDLPLLFQCCRSLCIVTDGLWSWLLLMYNFPIQTERGTGNTSYYCNFSISSAVFFLIFFLSIHIETNKPPKLTRTRVHMRHRASFW